MAQLCSLNIQTSISFMSRDLHKSLNNHPKAFGLMHKGIAPNRDHDRDIHLQQRNAQEINKEVKSILEVDKILETRIK